MNKTTEITHNINNGTVSAELERHPHGSDFWLFPHGTATASTVTLIKVREADVVIHWGDSRYRYHYKGEATPMTVVAYFFTTMSIGRTANFIKRECDLSSKNGERVA
jgi:hypothetical protein